MADFFEEKIYYHALNLAADNNFLFLAAAKDFFVSWKNAWEAGDYSSLNQSSSFRKKTYEKFLKNKKEIDPKKEWIKLEKQKINLLLLEEKNYPALLKEIYSPPLGLYFKGRIGNEPKIAVVGSRRATDYGRRAAKTIVFNMAQAGLTIASGLAIGIDSFSHEAALEAGGRTIAVLGSGFNHIFPQQNFRLAEKISAAGCLISEYHPDTKPDRHQFIARNRIVSGLSLGTIVVEAAAKSGALITTRLALEQNREVFAVPGTIFAPNSPGAKRLIQQGAKLILSAEDVLEDLPLDQLRLCEIKKSDGAAASNMPPIEKEIIKILATAAEALSTDEIIEMSGLNPIQIIQSLTNLELKSLIESNNGQYWKK